MNTKYLQNAACCIAASIVVQSMLLTVIVSSNPIAPATNQLSQLSPNQPSDVLSAADKKTVGQIKLLLDQREGPKSFEEANNFVQDIRNLYSRHQKNILSVEDPNLTELYKFLSKEEVFQLVRVDDEPFKLPTNDEDLPRLEKLIEADAVVRKIYGEPLRRFVEMKKQQAANNKVNSQNENKNVFQQIWCKISDSC